MHSWIVHDWLIVAEYVEAESFGRTVAVEQCTSEEPRRVPLNVAALPNHLHRFRPTLCTGSGTLGGPTRFYTETYSTIECIRKWFIKQREYFNFRCQVQLGHPVVIILRRGMK